MRQTFRVRFGTRHAPAPQVDTERPSDARQPDDHAHPTARYLALGHAIERGLADGTFASYAAAGRWLGVTKSRACILGHLALLAPDIQAAILAGDVTVSEHVLRPVCRLTDWAEQRAALEPTTPRVEDGPRPMTEAPGRRRPPREEPS